VEPGTVLERRLVLLRQCTNRPAGRSGRLAVDLWPLSHRLFMNPRWMGILVGRLGTRG